MEPMQDGRKVKLLICEDDKGLAEGLMIVASGEPWLEVVAPPCSSGPEIVDLAEKHAPDVVLMDVHIEGPMDGIEAARRVKEVSTESRVVILTNELTDALLIQAVGVGACGFLDKTVAMEDLMQTLRSAAEGDILIDQGRLAALVRKLGEEREARSEAEALKGVLSPREKEVLQLFAQGLSNPEVGRQLFISEHTVQSHVRNILAKLQVRSKLEAVALAARHGVVSL